MREAVPDVPGVVLERGALGELLVLRGGLKLGWMHEHGEKWHAYRRVDGFTGQLIGAFSKSEGVQAIVAAAPPPPTRMARNGHR